MEKKKWYHTVKKKKQAKFKMLKNCTSELKSFSDWTEALKKLVLVRAEVEEKQDMKLTSSRKTLEHIYGGGVKMAGE